MTERPTLPRPPPAAPPAASSRRALIIGLAAALVALAYAGYHYYQARQPYEWSGTVEARTISVGSRVGGRVKQVLAREGERVAAGQPLLIFESSDIEAQKLQARGQLEQARANLEKLERGARPEEIEQARARALTATAAWRETSTGARHEEVAAAAARLQAAQVAVDKAQLDQQRMQKLFASGAAAGAERDNTESALRGAMAQRDAAREQLDQLKNGARLEQLEQAAGRAAEARASERLVKAGSRVEDIQVARGQLEVAKGRLDAIEVMINELTVRAPRPARVESLDLRPGDIVQPNATAAILLEPDQLYVRIYVPETQIGHIHPGQEVAITVDSFPGKRFRGVVEYVSAVGEYSPRNLQTADERADQVFASRIGLGDRRGELGNGRNELRAGMAAFIQVNK